MQIHLKKGEKLYVNGAVLRVDRRTSVEFLNDVTFLLENHVMQADQADSPLKQLYFVVQTMLVDPQNAGLTMELFKHLTHRAQMATTSAILLETLDVTHRKVGEGRYFDALKVLRSSFEVEGELLMNKPALHRASQ